MCVHVHEFHTRTRTHTHTHTQTHTCTHTLPLCGLVQVTCITDPAAAASTPPGGTPPSFCVFPPVVQPLGNGRYSVSIMPGKIWCALWFVIDSHRLPSHVCACTHTHAHTEHTHRLLG